MAMYLNQSSDKFISYKNDDIFVDKSLLIKETNESLNRESKKFMCVTRPRRFGKTLAVSMLNSYYSKKGDSRELFNDLAIHEDPSFEKHLNKHNVFYIDMNSQFENSRDKNRFVCDLSENLLSDLDEAYGTDSFHFNGLPLNRAFAKIRASCGDRFIFLIDEWDVAYRKASRSKKLCDEYTNFLETLFKSSDVSSMIDLVYMTGILPIRRYITQSTLNMFTEFNMVDPDRLAYLFGFTEDEVKALCANYGEDFEPIKSWYDGYRLGGLEIYSPKSVVTAIQKGRCGKYWATSSAIEAVTDYMNYDHGALKAEIMRMLAGDKVELNPEKFSNDLTRVDSKDAALTVLVHLGYLAFLPYPSGSKGVCYIPNKEIEEEFETGLEALNWKSIYDPISNSLNLLEATIKGDDEEISIALDRNHQDLASPFSKNDEDVLGIVVIVSYYRARQYYVVKKEETSMNGRSDVSFFPTVPGYKPILIELKKGKSPDEAIEQIKRKAYWEAWGGYKGDVLLVGISYDEKTLKHHSKTEWIEIE